MARWLAAAAWLALAGAGVQAAELASQDRQAIRAVIESQLAAFARDDAAAAFAYAAPAIKAQIGTAERFMAMVRGAYAPVYRPRRVVFAELDTSGALPVQVVQIEGPRGGAFLAHYPMQRQADGGWLIAGCYLVPAPGESTAIPPSSTATLSISRVPPRLAAASTRAGRSATLTGSRVSASHIST